MIFVYVTFPNVASAKKIAGHLVANKLAACGNILPKMVSVYSWKKKLRTENETVLILKTVPRRLKALQKEIEKFHPYEVPCIVSLKASSANHAFAQWVHEQLS